MTKSVWHTTIIDKRGDVVPNASIEIRNEANNVLILTWLDKDKKIPGGNPLFADSDGYVFAYLTSGRYRVIASHGSGEIVWNDVLIIE